jgi:ABC-type transport system involved in cytochrome c biogenesis permease component
MLVVVCGYATTSNGYMGKSKSGSRALWIAAALASIIAIETFFAGDYRQGVADTCLIPIFAIWASGFNERKGIWRWTWQALMVIYIALMVGGFVSRWT